MLLIISVYFTMILLFIANITLVTYILPQHDLALLSHIIFFFFLCILYTVTTWSRLLSHYDVLLYKYFILSQHDLALLSHIMFFLYIFYIVLVYIYYMILLYSDLSPNVLTQKWLRQENSRSLRIALFCRNI
jgi:hypothetical protein